MSIYDSLLQIPLFKGVSIDAFNAIIEKHKFEFKVLNKGESLIKSGDVCSDVKFVISGAVCSELNSSNVKIKICETITAPNDLMINYVLGNNCYPSNVIVAEDNTGIMIIDKQDFLSIIQENRVILLNYLICLSRKSQTAFEAYDLIATDNIRAKFAFWILYFTSYNAENIVISAKQRDIYSFFGVQRSLFCSALEDMKDRGIIDFSAKEIKILDRKLLRLYYREAVG